MNTSKFVYRGVELPLDVDDLAVEARIQAALVHFTEESKALDKGKISGMVSVGQRAVEMIHALLDAIFDRQDAAAQLLEGATRLSEVTERLTRICEIIGEMRTLALKNASAPMAAVMEQMAAMEAPEAGTAKKGKAAAKPRVQ